MLGLLLRLIHLLPCPVACLLLDYPLLTTRETLQFAHDNSHADVSPLQSAELSALHAKKVDTMLELMGLEECADTIVGNSYIRGISGGQRRRVGVAEMLMGQARALFLDEIRSEPHARGRAAAAAPQFGFTCTCGLISCFCLPVVVATA